MTSTPQHTTYHVKPTLCFNLINWSRDATANCALRPMPSQTLQKVAPDCAYSCLIFTGPYYSLSLSSPLAYPFLPPALLCVPVEGRPRRSRKMDSQLPCRLKPSLCNSRCAASFITCAHGEEARWKGWSGGGGGGGRGGRMARDCGMRNTVAIFGGD